SSADLAFMDHLMSVPGPAKPYHYILNCHLERVISFFFFIGKASSEIYTLSLHDALPISASAALGKRFADLRHRAALPAPADALRSEEHTSELQSLAYLVCRLLLEKKNSVTLVGLSSPVFANYFA